MANFEEVRAAKMKVDEARLDLDTFQRNMGALLPKALEEADPDAPKSPLLTRLETLQCRVAQAEAKAAELDGKADVEVTMYQAGVEKVRTLSNQVNVAVLELERLLNLLKHSARIANDYAARTEKAAVFHDDWGILSSPYNDQRLQLPTLTIHQNCAIISMVSFRDSE